MNVTCPECQSIFRVDPAKVPATGVRARCSVCGGIITITGGTLTSMVPAAGKPFTPAQGQSRSGSGAWRTRTSGSMSPPVASPAEGLPADTGISPTPDHYATGSPAAPAPTPASTPPAQAYPTQTAASETRATATPVSQPLATGTLSASGSRRSINPFLNADPAQRARRLARALVSDLVAYHPQKREEGLRNGTLRQLFKEEIKKSYEEFADQVGREAAESTTYFQDALNEVLAGGQRIF